MIGLAWDETPGPVPSLAPFRSLCTSGSKALCQLAPGTLPSVPCLGLWAETSLPPLASRPQLDEPQGPALYPRLGLILATCKNKEGNRPLQIPLIQTLQPFQHTVTASRGQEGKNAKAIIMRARMGIVGQRLQKCPVGISRERDPV